jgi:iron-sulfur cluster repair protein YtfE (RIC family)
MKDVRPIKRHPALVNLSKDHHNGLLLCWKIRNGLAAGISTERISNYLLYFFEEDLKKHFHEEEELVFPTLPTDDPLRLQALSEHKNIYTQVEKIRQDRHAARLLEAFASMLDDHIRFEERILFQHLQQVLAPAQLESILHHSAERGHDCDTGWADKFWLK